MVYVIVFDAFLHETKEVVSPKSVTYTSSAIIFAVRQYGSRFE